METEIVCISQVGLLPGRSEAVHQPEPHGRLREGADDMG